MRKKNRRRGGLVTKIIQTFIRDTRVPSVREELYRLDVATTSTRGAKVRNRRQTVFLIKFAAITAMLVSATLGVRWAYVNVFYHDSEFTLSNLEISTDGALTQAQILDAAELEIGMNLMEIDLDAVKAKIEEQPLVIEAEIGRELPGLISITVKEREMIAWLSCPPHGIRARCAQRGFLIDSQGEVIGLRTLSKEFLPLPVIETWRMPHPEDGEAEVSESIDAAIELISKSQERFVEGGIKVVQVTVRSPWSIECLFSNDLDANFNRALLDDGLQNLTHILNHATKNGLQLATADLAISKNIPVTYFNPPSGATPGYRPTEEEKRIPNALRSLPINSQQPVDPQLAELRSILNQG